MDVKVNEVLAIWLLKHQVLWSKRALYMRTGICLLTTHFTDILTT